MPRRIQCKRTKGWRMPPNTMKVDRSTMWGNHAARRIGLTKGPAAVAEFERWIRNDASETYRQWAIETLRGKNLACWCALDQPCHADVLLELANRHPT